LFGSGAKKNHVDQAPWSIQVLTTEHLIEGAFHADKYTYGGEDIFAQSAAEGDDESNLDAFESVRLIEARIQPTGNLITPVQTFPGLELPTFDLVVAVIPADDASLKAAQKAYKAYHYPLDAVIYAGPYLLKAKLLSDYADASHSPFTNTYLIPLADVVIDCQVQGARLTSFRAPWLLLNGTLVHAFWIDGITPDS
jgi:hypothetical protein